MTKEQISKLENLQIKIAIAIDHLWLSIHKQTPKNDNWQWDVYEKLQAGQKSLAEVLSN
jgi:hypothetical protein